MSARAQTVSEPGPQRPSVTASDPMVSTEVLGRFIRSTGRIDADVLNVTVRASPYATLAAVYIVSVVLSDGTTTTLFMKQSPDGIDEHPDKPGSGHEPRIYETVLAGEDLPVPRYFGAVDDPRAGSRQVFLEYIEDWNLEHHTLDLWYLAAQRLADLHVRASATVQQGQLSFLPLFDERYFLDRARLALESVAAVAPGFQDRMNAVVDAYGPVANLLAAQPPTLVHNDLAPKNVLVDRAATPPRVCIVDWEMAGAGCGVLDLVHLKYGLDTSADAEMCRSYYDRIAGSSLVPASERGWRRLQSACTAHEAMTRLWRNRYWHKPVDVVAGWIAEAEAGVSASR